MSTSSGAGDAGTPAAPPDAPHDSSQGAWAMALSIAAVTLAAVGLVIKTRR
jgi:hypothetical protein